MSIQKIVAEHKKLSNEAGCLIRAMARVFEVSEMEIRKNFDVYKSRYLKIINNIQRLDSGGIKQIY